MRLARCEALRILRKQTPCRAGAGFIAELVDRWEREDIPPRWMRFVELFYEEELWTEHPMEMEQQVIEFAWSLFEE